MEDFKFEIIYVHIYTHTKVHICTVFFTLKCGLLVLQIERRFIVLYWLWREIVHFLSMLMTALTYSHILFKIPHLTMKNTVWIYNLLDREHLIIICMCVYEVFFVNLMVELTFVFMFADFNAPSYWRVYIRYMDMRLWSIIM